MLKMKKAWRPVKQPPKLTEYETFSAEAQKTLAAIEDKYNRLLDQLQQHVRHYDSSEYYKSIYNSSFRNNTSGASLNSFKAESEESQMCNFTETSRISAFTSANLPSDYLRSSLTVPASLQHMSESKQNKANAFLDIYNAKNPAVSVHSYQQPSFQEIQESVLSLTQRTHDPDSPCMDLEEQPPDGNNSLSHGKPTSKSNVLASGNFIVSPFNDLQVFESFSALESIPKCDTDTFFNEVMQQKYAKQPSHEFCNKNWTSHPFRTENGKKGDKSEIEKSTCSPDSGRDFRFDSCTTASFQVLSPKKETSIWGSCDRDQKNCPLNSSHIFMKQTASPSLEMSAVNFELNLSDLSLSQNSQRSLYSVDDSQEIKLKTDSTSSSYGANYKKNPEKELSLIEETRGSSLSVRPVETTDVLASEIKLTNESPTSDVNESSFNRNHKRLAEENPNVKDDFYEDESPLGTKSTPSSAGNISGQTACIKRQKKISDIFKSKKEASIGEAVSSKTKNAIGTLSNENKPESVNELSQTKKPKSRFKPPNKVKSASTNKTMNFPLEESKEFQCQSIINFTSLGIAEQEKNLQLLKCSQCLALSLVYSNNLGTVNDFFYTADRGKKKSSSQCIIGIVILTEKPETHCLQIPVSSISEPRVRKTILDVLSSKKTTKIIINCKDFLKGMHQLLGIDSSNDIGFCCENFEDPVIASWLADPEKQSLSFSEMCHIAHLQFREMDKDWLPCLHFTPQLMQAFRSKLKSENLWSLFVDIEMRLVPVLAFMELQTIKIDMDKLIKFSDILKDEYRTYIHFHSLMANESKLKKLEDAIYKEAGHKFALNSHIQLRQVLYEELQLDKKLPPEAKIGKTDVYNLKSTCESSLNRIKEIHPLPALILEYRQLQKLKSTYIDGIMSCVINGTLTTHWDQTAAATGRLTSYGPNIQAVPKTVIKVTDYQQNYVIGSEKSSDADISARETFVSGSECVFLAADFQQIELRILASLSGDSSLLSLFWQSQSEDIFMSLTSQWHQKPAESVTTEEREQTKRVVYSVLYGVGKEKLSEYLKVKPDAAKEIMNSFLSQFPAIDSFTKKCWEYAREFGYTETLCGRRRYFTHINSSSPVLRAQAQRQAVNFCVQGSAADICKLAMLTVEAKLRDAGHLSCRLLLQIHDELVWEVPVYQLEETKSLIQQAMEDTKTMCGKFCTLQVPLPVVLSSGTTWAHLTPGYTKGNQITQDN